MHICWVQLLFTILILKVDIEVENSEVFTKYLSSDSDGVPSLLKFGEKVHYDSTVSIQLLIHV